MTSLHTWSLHTWTCFASLGAKLNTEELMAQSLDLQAHTAWKFCTGVLGVQMIILQLATLCKQ